MRFPSSRFSNSQGFNFQQSHVMSSPSEKRQYLLRILPRNSPCRRCPPRVASVLHHFWYHRRWSIENWRVHRRLQFHPRRPSQREGPTSQCTPERGGNPQRNGCSPTDKACTTCCSFMRRQAEPYVRPIMKPALLAASSLHTNGERDRKRFSFLDRHHYTYCRLQKEVEGANFGIGYVDQ